MDSCIYGKINSHHYLDNLLFVMIFGWPEMSCLAASVHLGWPFDSVYSTVFVTCHFVANCIKTISPILRIFEALVFSCFFILRIIMSSSLIKMTNNIFRFSLKERISHPRNSLESDTSRKLYFTCGSYWSLKATLF